MEVEVKVIEMFPKLWSAVYWRHVNSGMMGKGHDPFHAARVGQRTWNIAQDEVTGRLGAIAGIAHNADRILQHELKIGRGDVPEKMIIDLINEWLGLVDLTEKEHSISTDALLKHDQPNDPEDSEVLKTLKDADRLVNLEADAIMRAAQFYHNCPAADPVHWLSDPKATFKEPRSVIRDLVQCRKEWTDFNDPRYGIRLPVAQKQATDLMNYILNYVEKVKKDFEAAGLLPFTPPPK